MGDLLGSLVWGAKNGQYCVIVGGSLQYGIRAIAQPEMVGAFTIGPAILTRPDNTTRN
jgi:hypothetical protein